MYNTYQQLSLLVDYVISKLSSIEILRIKLITLKPHTNYGQQERERKAASVPISSVR